MGPVVFTKAGIAVDTSLAALFRGRRRYYAIPKNLMVTKPKPPTPAPPLPAVDPASTPATAPAPTPATAPTPEPTAAPPQGSNDTPSPPEVVPPPWTEIQDAMLRGLKDYQHKTFREIGTMIDERDAEECRERYDELVAISIADKKAAEEEEAKIKKAEEQAREEAEMRTWWAIHKAEKAKAADDELRVKEVQAKREEVILAENAKCEEIIKTKAMIAEKAKNEEHHKEAKASTAEKRSQEKQAKKKEGDTDADANSDKDKKGNKEKIRGKDKSTASGKNKRKDQEPRAKDDTSFSTTTTTRDQRPIINLEGLNDEEIEEAPLLWHLHSQSEQQKWNEMAARYFKATGQQIPAKELEKKLKAMGI